MLNFVCNVSTDKHTPASRFEADIAHHFFLPPSQKCSIYSKCKSTRSCVAGARFLRCPRHREYPGSGVDSILPSTREALYSACHAITCVIRTRCDFPRKINPPLLSRRAKNTRRGSGTRVKSRRLTELRPLRKREREILLHIRARRTANAQRNWSYFLLLRTFPLFSAIPSKRVPFNSIRAKCTSTISPNIIVRRYWYYMPNKLSSKINGQFVKWFYKYNICISNKID